MIILLFTLIINPTDSALDGAQVGICFYDLTNDSFLYCYNWNKNFIPASNFKIFTTAAGLFLLGPEHRFKTRFGIDDHNNLYIIAGGDPTLSREMFIKKLKDVEERFKNRINQITIESRAIHGFRYPWGWSWHYLDAAYAPRVTGLILDGNTFELKISPGEKVGDSIIYCFKPQYNDIFIDNQALTLEPDSGWRIDLYRELGSNRVHIYGGVGLDCHERNIPISLIDPISSHQEIIKKILGDGSRVRISTREETLPMIEVVDSILSPPLLIVLKRMNFESENLYAEAIVNALAKSDTVASTLNSGLSEMKHLLVRFGIDTTKIAIYDGSGLSRFNRLTPMSMIKLLITLYRSRYRDQFISLLPYGGEGTLWNRFKEEGERIRCKTGTIYGVSCLSGYILNDNRKIAFTIMVNDFLGKRSTIEKWEDETCRRFLEQ